jgi:HB1, ASXL, restriction endonuclease HTH domain
MSAKKTSAKKSAPAAKKGPQKRKTEAGKAKSLPAERAVEPQSAQQSTNVTDPAASEAAAGSAEVSTALPSQADPAPLQTDASAEASPVRKRKTKEQNGDAKLSAIDAAAKVLGEAGTPMNAKQMIEAMAEKGYWTSPGGKTPSATLFSAILREIATKGEQSRFVKAGRGQFAIKA